VAADDEEIKPVGQTEQTDAPADEEKYPGTHAEHTQLVAPSLEKEGL